MSKVVIKECREDTYEHRSRINHELCMHKAVELRKDNFIADLAAKLYRGKYR